MPVPDDFKSAPPIRPSIALASLATAVLLIAWVLLAIVVLYVPGVDSGGCGWLAAMAFVEWGLAMFGAFIMELGL